MDFILEKGRGKKDILTRKWPQSDLERFFFYLQRTIPVLSSLSPLANSGIGGGEKVGIREDKDSVSFRYISSLAVLQKWEGHKDEASVAPESTLITRARVG